MRTKMLHNLCSGGGGWWRLRLGVPLAALLVLFGQVPEAAAQQEPLQLSVGDQRILYLDRQTDTNHSITFPAATGGTEPYAYEFAGEGATDLAPGEDDVLVLPGVNLRFNPTTRTLSGTPGLVGVFNQLGYTVTDATGAFAWAIIELRICDDGAEADGRTICTVPVFDTIVIDFPEDSTFSQNAPITTWTLPQATAGGTGTHADRIQYSLEVGEFVPGRGFVGDVTLNGLPAGLTCVREGQTTSCDDYDTTAHLHLPPVLSGTPTETGTWLMQYLVSDITNRFAPGGTIAATFNLVVADGPAFGPADQIGDDAHSYEAGAAVAGTQTVLPEITSAVGGVTYSLLNSADETVDVAVPGLSFDADTRTLSGTPNIAGTTRLTYTATDANDAETQQDFRLVVAGPQLAAVSTQTYSIGTAITTLTLPEATQSDGTTAYSATVTYSLLNSADETVDVAIPGLSFDAANRTLSGTPVTVDGTVMLTYTATDGNGNAGEQVFSVEVTGPELPRQSTIFLSAGTETSVTLDEAVVAGTTTTYARPVTYSLTADGGTVEAAVPGLSFDPSTRIISGTPTQATHSLGISMAYTATDDLGNTSTGYFGLVVTGPSFQGQPGIVRLTFPALAVIAPTTLVAATQSDGTTAYGPTVAYTLLEYLTDEDLSATIPGLRFDSATRILSGTPTTPGEHFLNYIGTDIYGNVTPNRPSLYGGQDFALIYQITVTGPQLAAVDDRSGSAGSALTAAAAAALPEASGSTAEVVTYSLTGPEGPDGEPEPVEDAVPGLVFDPATRELSGTPTMTGTTRLTYRAEDTGGNGDTEFFTFTVTGPTLAQQGTSGVLTSGGAGLTLTPTILTTATQTVTTTAYGTALEYSLAGPDGEPVEVAVPGLVFVPATRELSGTSNVVGTTTLTYTATDIYGNTGMTVFDLVVPGVTLALPTTITGTPVPAVTYAVGTAITSTTFPRPGTGVFRPEAQTMRLLGGLPDGLDFDEVSGVLSGTPAVAGTATLTWEVTDFYDNTATSPFTVVVTADEISLAAPADRTYNVGVALAAGGDNLLAQAMLSSAALDDDDVTYGISALPPGVSFNESTRVLSGTPTTPMAATPVVYSATDSSGSTATQTFTVTVAGVTIGNLSNATRTFTAGEAPSSGTTFGAATNPSGTAVTLTYAIATPADQHGNRMPLAEAVPGLTFTQAATPSATNAGSISGTPTMTGTTSLLYSATDDYGNRAETALTIVIDGGPTLAAQGDLTFTIGETLPTATPTMLAVATAAASSTDDNLAISTYSLTGADSTPLGEAVPGLSFDPDPEMRILSGTPTRSGATLLTYTATDASGNIATATFTATVNGPTLATAPAAITDTVDGGAIAAVTLSAATNVDSSLTLTYDVTGAGETSLGDAVPGLSFNPATRMLSGTPTVVGTTTLTYSASVSTAAGISTATQTFTVTLSGLTLPGPDDLTEVVGTAINPAVTLSAVTSTLTGTFPLVYAVTGPDGTSLGDAVPGLSFDPTTRVLSGTPTAAGTTTLSYTVTDSNGNVSSQDFTATVSGLALSLTDATRTYAIGVALTTGVQLGAATDANDAAMVIYAVEDPADPTVVVDGTPGSAVPGLSFDPAVGTRSLSGTPTAAGTYPLIYSATDQFGNRVTTDLTVVVDGLALAAELAQTLTLGNIFLGITLSEVTRGSDMPTATYTLRDSAGNDVDATDNAVPGLSFDTNTRVLSGTPSAAGGVTVLTYTATVGSYTATTTFSITVLELALDSVLADMTYEAGTTLATTLTLPELVNVGSLTVSYTLQDSAGLNVDATATTGNAVPGLVFDPATRELSGTPTSANGVFSLTYTATTETTTTVPVAYTEMQIFTVTVVGGPTLAVVDDQTYPLGGAITALTLSAAGSASGFTGVAYTLQDSNGDDVDATDNAVAGLTFTPSTRILTGTPTTPGATALTYAVTGVGGYSVPARTFTLTVTGPTLSTDDRSFPAGTSIAGAATLTTLDEVTGIDTGLTVTYALTGPSAAALGTAVPGLSFAAGTRILSGTPTTPGATVLTYTAAITATPDVAVATTGTTALTFTVTGPALGPLGTPTRTYPVGVALSGSVQLAAATGAATPTYTVTAAGPGGAAVDGTAGSAVPGLSFNADAAIRSFSGTPTVAGTYPLTYRVSDGLGNTGMTPVTVVVTGPALAVVADQAYTQGTAISTLSLGAAVNDGTTDAYSGGGTVTYALTGVPDGLTFDATMRELSGMPTAAGAFQLTYTATDSTALDDSEREASQVFGVTVNPPVAFDFDSITVATTYTYTTSLITPLVLPFATGGTGAITYALTGPSGTALDGTTSSAVPSLTFTAAAATRALSGTPTGTLTATELTYTATDAQSATATTSFTVVVTDSDLLLPGAADRTYPDQTYSAGALIPPLTLPGTNSGASTKTYTLTGPGDVALGTAVPGLTFTQADPPSTDNAGTLSGTPTMVGATELTYTAMEGAESDSFMFTVTVSGAPVFRAGQVDRSYSVGGAVSLILPAAAGSATPTYTLAPLPDGLIFDSVPRRLHGRPVAPGTTELVYTARTAGGTDTLTFSVTVSGLTFASTQADQDAWPVGAEITTVTLPEASGVSGSVTYALTGPGAVALGTAVPGLSFNATATVRALSGTPTVVGTTVLTYTATDAYGNTEDQTFRVEVAGMVFEDTVADQSYPVGVEIPPAERLELPEVQAAGTGSLTYTLRDSAGLNVDATAMTGNAVPGLVFDPATRILSGTPTATGTFVLTYAVTGAGITTGSTVTPLTFSVTVTGEGPTFTATIPDQEHASGARIPDVQLPEATGGFGTLTYSLVGANEADLTDVSGLVFDAFSRTMSGGTMGAAATVLTYIATDEGGNTDSMSFALRLLPVMGFVDVVPDQIYTRPTASVSDNPAVPSVDAPLARDTAVLPLTLPEARLDVEDEDATVTYSLTGPNGTDLSELGQMNFAPVSRVLSGVPNRLRPNVQEKTYLLTYTATDGDGTVVGVLNFEVKLVPLPTFDTAFFARFVASTPGGDLPATWPPGEAIPTVTFPEGTGYGEQQYSLIDAATRDNVDIPGLTFDPDDRTLSGTPRILDGEFVLQYWVCNRVAMNALCAFTDPGFTVSISPVVGSFNVDVEDQTYAVNAPLPTRLPLPAALPSGPAYEYDLYPLPEGLVFHSGFLYGTPTVTGTTELTYTATHPETLNVEFLTFTVVVTGGPVFSSEVGNQGFAKDVAITSLTLPEASYGGFRVLAYALFNDQGDDVIEDIAGEGGLTFQPRTRVLSGTPTENGVTELTYKVEEGGGEGLSDERVFYVVVQDANMNSRPEPIGAAELPVVDGEQLSTTLTAQPGMTDTVELSHYFMDPDQDSRTLDYSSCVLVDSMMLDNVGQPVQVCMGSENADPGAAPPRVRIRGQSRSKLVLEYMPDVPASGPTQVRATRESRQVMEETINEVLMVTAIDSFGASAQRRLFATNVSGADDSDDSEGGPELSDDPFVDVTLTVDSGETTYEEETDNRLCDHFTSGDGETCSEEYRFSVSVENEAIASASVGTETLTTNTSLTLTPNGLGETVVTVTATDMNNRSATGTFLLTVQDRTVASINQVILPEVARAVAGHIVDAIAHRMEQARAGIATAGTIGGQTSLASALAAHGEAMQEGTRSLEDLLGDSNFALSLGGGDGEDGTSSVSLWGSGDYRSLSGDSEGIKFDGDVLSVHLGADTRLREDVLAGLMVSRSRSDLEYESTSHNGDQELTVTNVSPYVGWSALDGAMDLWASVSYGTGDLEMSYGRDGSDQASSDVGMRTLAAGLSGQVMEFEAGGTLRVKGDALQTTLEVDGSDNGALERGSFKANRLRVSAEASLPRTTESGARLEPSVEAGIRHDGGDGNTGSGIELSVGLRHTQPASGITLEGGAYTLVGRDDYQEWGVNGQFRIAAGTAGRGLSLNLSPSYGNIPDGLQQVWQQDAIERGANVRDASMRVDARLGYGLPALGGRGLLTPYSEITFEENNTYRLGVKWDAGSILRLDLAGETSGGSAGSEVLLKAEVLF